MPAVVVERTTPREIRLVTAERGSLGAIEQARSAEMVVCREFRLEPLNGRIAQLSPRWQQIAYARAHAAWCQWLRHWHLTGDQRALRTALVCQQIAEEKLAALRARGVAPHMQPSRYRPVPLEACDGVASLTRSLGSHIKTQPPRLGQNIWHVATPL
jgi:hypothetical protein